MKEKLSKVRIKVYTRGSVVDYPKKDRAGMFQNFFF